MLESKMKSKIAIFLTFVMAGCSDSVLLVEDEDWAQHGLNSQETRFSPLEEITAKNIDQLDVAWSADFSARSLRGVEATPIVVDGVMYVSGPWSVVMALDAASGDKLWEYDPKVDGAWARRACCDVVNRGVAYHEGKVIVGVLDGRLVALDAEQGTEIWSVQTTRKDRSYTITGAPRIVKDKVLIGNGGGEYGVRGYLTAYDIDSGKQMWRFHTVPGDPNAGFESAAMEIAAQSWAGEWWEHGGGGTVWDSMAYDPELDLLYVGTGNGSPWSYRERSNGQGDNLYLTSIVALRPDTGEYVWHFQQVPADEWDYTATQHMILADLEIAGMQRKVIMQAPKNGFFYVLDRKTGAFISGTPYVDVTWAEGLDPETGRPEIAADARYSITGKPFMGFPSPAGGHNWQPMSFNPQTGLVYFPISEMPYGYIASEPGTVRHNRRGWNTGQDPVKTAMPEDPAIREQIGSMVQGALIAWDPVEGTRKWSVPMTYPWNGGVLSTGAGLVFQGNGSGEFSAYAAEDGRKLWSRQLGSGIVAPPITYSVNGVQYVAVAVGWGGILPLNLGEVLKGSARPKVNQVVAFRIGGTGELPKIAEEQDISVLPIASSATATSIANGRKLYHQYCWMCHGDTAVNRGGVPDLRRAPSLDGAEVFRAFVLNGAGETMGMPEFREELDADDVEDIRAYVAKRRNDLVHAGGE